MASGRFVPLIESYQTQLIYTSKFSNPASFSFSSLKWEEDVVSTTKDCVSEWMNIYLSYP